MESLPSVIDAAKEFKAKALKLTEELCTLANVSIDSPDRNYFFRKIFGKQKKHELNENWIFCLHGAECRFTNKVTGEELEVIMTNGLELGVLDTYFFYKFCETSEEFKHLGNLYKGHLKMLEMDLVELYEKGALKRIANDEPALSRSLTA